MIYQKKYCSQKLLHPIWDQNLHKNSIWYRYNCQTEQNRSYLQTSWTMHRTYNKTKKVNNIIWSGPGAYDTKWHYYTTTCTWQGHYSFRVRLLTNLLGLCDVTDVVIVMKSVIFIVLNYHSLTRHVKSLFTFQTAVLYKKYKIRFSSCGNYHACVAPFLVCIKGNRVVSARNLAPLP